MVFLSLGWQEIKILSEEQVLVLCSAFKWRVAIAGKWRALKAKSARVWQLGTVWIPWTHNGWVSQFGRGWHWSTFKTTGCKVNGYNVQVWRTHHKSMKINVNHWGVLKCVRIELIGINLNRGFTNRILHGQKWSCYIVWLLSFQKIKQVGFYVTWIQQLW